MPNPIAAVEVHPQWAPYERMLRAWLGSANSPPIVDAMVEQVQPIFLNRLADADAMVAAMPKAASAIDMAGAGWSVSLPGNDGQLLAQVNQWVAGLVFGMLQEIVAREVALHGGPPS